MARGKWLSEEEKAEITRMRAGGMTNAQIAAQTQRGLKTIQRVLTGKYSSASEGEALGPAGDVPATACAALPVHIQHLPERVSQPPLRQAGTPATTVGVEVSATPPVRQVRDLHASTSAKPPTTTTSKIPTRPTKVPRQPPASSHRDTVMPSIVSPPRSILKFAASTRCSSLQVDSARTKAIQDQPRHKLLPSAQVGVAVIPQITPGRESGTARHVAELPNATPMRRNVQSSSHPPTGTALPNSNIGIPNVNRIVPVTRGHSVVIPIDDSPLHCHDHAEDHMESMANLIPDEDSDDDMCLSPQPQLPVSRPRRSTQDIRRQNDNLAALERNRPLGQLAHAIDEDRARGAPPATMAMTESPLHSFERQLQQSSQISYSSSSASQIEPEPTVAKKRKVIPGVISSTQEDPIESALMMLEDAFTSVTKGYKFNADKERLTLLFQRFQADVRLVQLERKQRQTQDISFST